MLSGRDIVVVNEDNLDAPVDVRVVVHQLSDSVDELDDRLGADVAGSGLRAENEDAVGCVQRRVVLHAEVQVQDVEGIEQLTLVLMQALDLDIKDRFWIDFHTLCFLQVTSQFTLVVSLDAFQFFFNICSASEFQQAFELSCIMVPVATQQLI